jgi:UDP:flavonoid glycosyltransferase YjiC (YdhE family)
MLPVAKALREAGHSICFAIANDFASHILAEGFEHRAGGDSLNALVATADLEVPNHSAGRKAAHMFTHLAPRSLFKPLLAIAKEMQPDILLHEESEYAAPLVAAILGIPNVAIGWPSPLRPRDQLDLLTRLLAGFWTQAGIKPRPYGGIFAGLFLDSCPPSFQTEFGRTIPTARVYQPASITPSQDNCLPIQKKFAAGPIVHATFGTVDTYNRADALYRSLIAAISDDSVNLVLTVGQGNSIGADIPIPSNVHVADYIPHGDLVPHCDAMICHGGCGSTIAALACGIPLIVIPRGGAVQMRNAVACERAGVGHWLDESDANPDRLRKMIYKILGNPQYKHRAQEAAAEIRAMPRATETVAWIEMLASRQ